MAAEFYFNKELADLDVVQMLSLIIRMENPILSKSKEKGEELDKKLMELKSKYQFANIK